jgi:sugar lactone lactonase YvrE
MGTQKNARLVAGCVMLAFGIVVPFSGISAQSASTRLITTIAGKGISGYSGDGGPATMAEISAVSFVTVDASGNVYFSDAGNNRIRKVSTSGIITTIAGNGMEAFSGDGGQANAAAIYRPSGIALDSSGNLYFVDAGNIRVRKISVSGVISTVAGNGTYGFSGDGGPATSAELGHPVAVALDLSGNLYVSEFDNRRIRKVDAAGIITTIAGDGTAGFNGDNLPANSAHISQPRSLIADSAGNLYFADSTDNRVRKISTTGMITTIAGGGTSTLADGGAATAGGLSAPSSIAFDASGNLYIAEQDDNRIRKVDISGIITTVAGDGTFGYNGDEIAATSAKLATPSGIAIDSKGDLYIADFNNYRIRKVH